MLPGWVNAFVQSGKVKVGLYACPGCANVWVSGMQAAVCPACQHTSPEALDPVAARGDLWEEGEQAIASVPEPPLEMSVRYLLMILAQAGLL